MPALTDVPALPATASTPNAALTDDVQAQFLADAAFCIRQMKQQVTPNHEAIIGHVKSRVEVAYVAAALALLTGRFLKKNGKPNPTAAADAFGKPALKISPTFKYVCQNGIPVSQYGNRSSS